MPEFYESQSQSIVMGQNYPELAKISQGEQLQGLPAGPRPYPVDSDKALGIQGSKVLTY